MNTSQLQQFATDARTALMSAIEPRVREALDPNSVLHADNTAACKHLAHNAPSSDDRHAFDAYVEELTERYAYRWFNRIIAFRYMDVHGYTVTPVVSSADMTNAAALPEILAAARRGEYDERVFGPAIRTNEAIKQRVEAIFNGGTTTADPQSTAYGLLMSAACNYWHTYLPFLFDEPNTIDDTIDRVLMPQNLLADGSPLREAIKAMTPEACGVGTTSGNVEIIGWLYQFYIAPRKDSVMAGFKKGKKAGAAEIPAATQLFTPEWIVRYLVQNTVGRLWMVNHPNCALAEGWEYYIAPTSDDDTAQLTVSAPEELTVCDPACGSGHMLTYAFDLLYEIYEDEGYAPSDIPGLILEHNLFGMEIDERAAQLAAFALTMKARGRSRRFFRKQVLPHIEQIKRIQFTEEEAEELNELYDVTLPSESWNTYANADVFGSLIQPDTMLATVCDNIVESDAPALYAADLIERGNRALEQTRYLSRTYTAVIGNPPYMGGKNMSTQLKQYVEQHYPKGKSDLFAAFMLRCMHLVTQHGFLGFMTPYVWMFIHSYEDLRKQIIDQDHITSLIQLEYSGFDGATVPICTFVLQQGRNSEQGSYIRLSNFPGAMQQAPRTREIIAAHKMAAQHLPYAHAEMNEHFYEVNQQEFTQIPGSPIVYWLPEALISDFSNPDLASLAECKHGMSTGNNESVLRYWHEIDYNQIILDCESEQQAYSMTGWFPYNKGGEYRKWYGNRNFVIRYDKSGQDYMRTLPGFRHDGHAYFFKPAISWSKISSGEPAFRAFPNGYVFDVAGCSFFPNDLTDYNMLLGICNSSTIRNILAAISPTLNYEVGQITKIPICKVDNTDLVKKLTSISKKDYNSSLLSFDFQTLDIFIDNQQQLNNAIQETISIYDAISIEQRKMNLTMTF